MRIVLADDVPLFREGLACLLRDRGHQVTITSNCYELIATARRRKHDLVLADSNLSQSANIVGATAGGVRAVIELRRADPKLNVVVLYCEANLEAARALLATGASHTAYLRKRRVLGVQSLMEALNRVVAGGTLVDVGLTKTMGVGTDPSASESGESATDAVALLPRRRSEVLSYMADGYSNWRIAKEMSVTEAAVARHIAQIYSQLGLKRSVDTNRRVQAVLQLLQHRDRAIKAAVGSSAGQMYTDRLRW